MEVISQCQQEIAKILGPKTFCGISEALCCKPVYANFEVYKAHLLTIYQLPRVQFLEESSESASLNFLRSPLAIDHFTVLCSVTRPLNKGETGLDLALIKTSLLFLYSCFRKGCPKEA